MSRSLRFGMRPGIPDLVTGAMPQGEWPRHSRHRPLSGLRCSRQHAWLLPRSETVRIRPIPLHTHWSSRGQDSAPVMRIRGFESHPVLSFLIVRVVGREIVRAATPFVHESCLREDRHLPDRECSPLSRRSLRISVWESLVLRVPRAHEIAGSNPATLTVPLARPCAGTGR